ncbi:hypothetical protein HHX47_DHR5000165 [Lentinula edodes]|nr:hypothetical protein HHX47_DHR5000165 [Lentinula edodes]
MAPTRPRSLRVLAFGSRRNSSPGPRSPSPTFSETTNVSGMNFGADGPSKIITRADLKASLQAYEQLMNSCATYRAALVTVSNATAEFADAMERCSTLKGPSYEAGTRLQAGSGLHHLIGNHMHVLAETLDRNFEKPLRQHLETYRTIVTERSLSYERALKEKSEIIRHTEKRNMNGKERNLQSFREALAVLQRQVDELDELKAEHYAEIVEHEEEVWDVVQGKRTFVNNDTVNTYSRARKYGRSPVRFKQYVVVAESEHSLIPFRILCMGRRAFFSSLIIPSLRFPYNAHPPSFTTRKYGPQFPKSRI